jgi:glycerate 2-kinase
MRFEATLLLRDMFLAAISAADPKVVIPKHFPKLTHTGKTILLGAGKASAAMASAAEPLCPRPVEGMVITRYGHGVPCKNLTVIEAAHPVPDDAGRRAAERMLSFVKGLDKDDLVIFLLSGGASALLALPLPGISLDELAGLTRGLLRSGASINEMNCVRKHLSQLSGGRLAVAASPARLITLAISDVAHDDPSVIGSGPTIGDPTTARDALRILRRYDVRPSEATVAILENPAIETPKPDNNVFRHTEFHIIASARQSLDAAFSAASQKGMDVISLGDAVEGEAREVGLAHARLVQEHLARQRELQKPLVIMSGGETTVTVRGDGRGGRNVEYLLALAVALDGVKGVFALAGDTDGIDGTETNAGAVMTPDSIERARSKGLDPAAILENNDGFGFFSALDDLVITGPTLTNVNDFRAIAILPI